MTIKLRNGIFLAPFHPLDEDPTLCIQRDLELIEHLDRLGYDEAWVGAHHSAGFEIIPKLFAGERVTQKSDWFDLTNATCQLRPYTWPRPEICVASSVTPSGG